MIDILGILDLSEILREYKSPLSEERVSRICRCIADKIASLEANIVRSKQGKIQYVRDSVYQIGEELKRQERTNIMSQKQFLEP